MTWAARGPNGQWTGAIYQNVNAEIVAHHARFGESVLQVGSLDRQSDGSWLASKITLAEWRASAVVTRLQARAALMIAGKLDAADTAVAASDDPLIKLAWAELVEIPRNSAALASIAASIALDDADLDDLFRAAQEITV